MKKKKPLDEHNENVINFENIIDNTLSNNEIDADLSESEEEALAFIAGFIAYSKA